MQPTATNPKKRLKKTIEKKTIAKKPIQAPGKTRQGKARQGGGKVQPTATIATIAKKTIAHFSATATANNPSKTDVAQWSYLFHKWVGWICGWC